MHLMIHPEWRRDVQPLFMQVSETAQPTFPTPGTAYACHSDLHLERCGTWLNVQGCDTAGNLERYTT